MLFVSLTVNQIQITLQALLTATIGLSTVRQQVNESFAQSLADGVDVGEADTLYTAERTIAASSSENLDLAGSLTDVFGATITFAKVKALYIQALSTNTNNVQVQREGTNGVPIFMALGDGIELSPGAAFLVFDPAGYAVTAGTGDLLAVTNSGAGSSVTYRIIIIGTST